MQRQVLKKIPYILIPLVLTAVFFCVYSIPAGNAAYADERIEVYLGGYPIGIAAKSEYLIVDEFVNVTNSEGSSSPALLAGVQKGDVIVTVNGKRPRNASDLVEQIKKSDTILLSVKRGKKLMDFSIKTVFDPALKENKIGLSVKDDLIGIGTMTFVTKNNEFGALGHGIDDEYGHVSYYQKGEIFDCAVTGYNVADRNKPGELRGTVHFDKPIGRIDKNVFCGIFGEMIMDRKELLQRGRPIAVGDRTTVENGKAQILTTIEGTEPKMYDIEIIKAVGQSEPADKSMVIRVTDQELRRTTGGILQGMSGSPILQNGRIIGAVTHVFTADSTKGYGVYIDWMLQNALKKA